MITELRTSLYNEYLCIAKQHRYMFIEAKKNFCQLESYGVEEELAENHSKMIDAEYLTKEYSSKISVTFSAMALEAFLFDYAAHNLGDSFVKEHLDKLDPCSKLLVYQKLSGLDVVPKSNHLYGKVKEIFNCRNSLVHHKSKKFELDKLAASCDHREEFSLKIENIAEHAAETIEQVINAMGKI